MFMSYLDILPHRIRSYKSLYKKMPDCYVSYEFEIER